MKNKRFTISMVAAACAAAFSANAQDLYITGVSNENIGMFDQRLGLTIVDPAGPSTVDKLQTGRSVADRRAAISFATGNFSTGTDLSVLSGLSTLGSLDRYLYKALSADNNFSGDLTLGTGTSPLDGGNAPNLPLVLDLGESRLDTSGTLQTQGAVFVSTVNSYASRGALSLDGVRRTTVNATSLDIEASRSGRITTAQLIELGAPPTDGSGNVTGGVPATFKVVLDLNSTLKNGAAFDFLSETTDQASNVATFDFRGNDISASNLFDTSYVMNSSALTRVESTNPNRQIVTITFNRANDEYITKSSTNNHPSNDAALKLGTIAADGVALGDMQTALTRLDVNDFGYGNNAQNLAVQVKRLAPIANNVFAIISFDSMRLATGAIDYRMAARRGNWSGYSAADESFWLRGVASSANSSGSVPVATITAQDTAGHDGFKAKASGVVAGYDKRVSPNLLVGASFGALSTNIGLSDDRAGEASKMSQNVWSLYAEATSDNAAFVATKLNYGTGSITGMRRTAIDRVAEFTFDTRNTEVAVKTGKRFDLSNGRSAITPYLQVSRANYTQANYQETGAGDLSLNISELNIGRTTAEVGVSMSHKGRFNGVKALTVLGVSVGKDLSVSDQTIHARYTGDTHTQHANYTSFTTPAEAWATKYVHLQLDLQLEVSKGAMFKWGVDAELRQGRQKYSSDISMNWVY